MTHHKSYQLKIMTTSNSQLVFAHSTVCLFVYLFDLPQVVADVPRIVELHPISQDLRVLVLKTLRCSSSSTLADALSSSSGITCTALYAELPLSKAEIDAVLSTLPVYFDGRTPASSSSH